MPLSEHEQQLLEQMEQALYAEDPKFATSMQGGSKAAQRRRYAVGVVGVLVGLALVLVGISTTMWVGAAGFVVMVAAIAYATIPVRKNKPGLGAVQEDGTIRPAAPASRPGLRRPGGQSRPRQARTGGFMQRMEQRWERRRDERF